MAMSDAQKRATAKYNGAHYDQLRFDAPRGFKDDVRAAAAAAGVSPSTFMREAVQTRLDTRPTDTTIDQCLAHGDTTIAHGDYMDGIPCTGTSVPCTASVVSDTAIVIPSAPPERSNSDDSPTDDLPF